MIVRIWRTKIDPTRAGEYEAFARDQSLPMFRQQSGFLGVLFVGSDGRRAVATLWEDADSIERLSRSTTHQATVSRLAETGLLRGQQSVEVLTEHGDPLHVEALERLFSGVLDARWVNEPPSRGPDDGPD